VVPVSRRAHLFSGGGESIESNLRVTPAVRLTGLEGSFFVFVGSDRPHGLSTPNNQPDSVFHSQRRYMARASRATEGNHSYAVIVRRRSDGTEGQTAATPRIGVRPHVDGRAPHHA
jgi:hypothetical protein